MIFVWQCCNVSEEACALGERSLLPLQRMNLKYERRCSNSEDIDPILGLHMIMVALRSGVSIPRALNTVGDAMPGGRGLWMESVSKALLSGCTWREAWSAPYSVDYSTKSGSNSLMLSHWLSTSLEESWCCGASPVPVLRALTNNYEQSLRNVARQETARLSVRLLLPVGLCFLPAFLCIGILPTIVSMVR